MAKNKKKEQVVEEPEEEKPQEEEAPVKRPEESEDDDDDDDDSSSDEDDDLVLEGVIVRNPDVADSDDTSSEESEEEGEDSTKKDSKKRLASKKVSPKPVTKKSKDSKGQAAAVVVAKKKKSKKEGPEIIDVEFTFCDMDEKYVWGMKALLASQSPAYALGSMALSDLMVENISVGTVVSVEGDEEGTVYGFASILNLATYQEHACIQALKKLCLAKCPEDRKQELETVLSGKTKRPAGFFLHGRMVNMPLEIVHVLHQQLVQDMDWAVENAQGGQNERKSLDFGAFVRMAPTYRMAQSQTYKFFDDEIFASHGEFSYEIELPKPFGAEDTPYCSVIVMTKTGHRAAMKDIEQMLDGSAMPGGSR
jgi:protein BCP1